MLYSIELFATSSKRQTLNIYPQFKMIDKFTSELDAYEFTTFPVSEELDFDFKNHNGFIPVVLKANGEEFRIMYLSFYKLVQQTYNPNSYAYLIQCVSPTFNLQRNTLPNKLITQPITDTKRSVWEELNKIMEVYADDITLDPDLQELMSRPCPELQFVKSTLHEILITLFAVCGLAPKMAYFNFLSYIDLKSSTNAKNWKSSEIFIRDEKSNSVESYADALDYDIENAIGEEEDITTQWIAPLSDEAFISDDNFVWKMPSDIYEIVKVEALADIKYTKTDAPTNWEEAKGIVAEITDYVIPKEVWETLKESIVVGAIKGKFKRNYLYYEGNTIYGNHSEKEWVGSESGKAIANAIIWYFLNIDFGGLLPNYSAVAVTSDYRNILLRVTYKSQTNGLRVKIVRNGIDKPINNLISNQEESYVDINNFGSQKKEYINRIGNELYKGECNFDLSKIQYLSELDIPQLGDRVDDQYIITQREMQFNENNLIVNYIMAKDYIFLTGYSGLNQMKRFTSIDTKNTVIRNDNFMYNFKIETINGNGADDELLKKVIANYGNKSENGLMLHN